MHCISEGAEEGNGWTIITLQSLWGSVTLNGHWQGGNRVSAMIFLAFEYEYSDLFTECKFLIYTNPD